MQVEKQTTWRGLDWTSHAAHAASVASGVVRAGAAGSNAARPRLSR